VELRSKQSSGSKIDLQGGGKSLVSAQSTVTQRFSPS
jgi:hypothetical protein